jgi:hypothetical protein
MSNKILVLVGALTMITAVPAFAERPLKLSIPFDFNVGSTNMEAGDYQVSFPNPSAVLIQRVDRRQSTIVLTNHKQATASEKNARLVFHRYGDRHFLSQIWSPDYVNGRVVVQSKAEVELARRFTNGDLVALQPKR